MFNVNNFVIDHVLRGMMVHSVNGSVLWSINQITEPSLSVTSETAEAVDALGTPIATFNRGKKAEFSANNSVFDLGLFAAQNGVNKTIGEAGATIKVPAFEEITVPQTQSTAVALKHTPTSATVPTVIYKVNGDGTLGSKLEVADTAGAGKFTYASGAITFATSGATSGDKYFVQYEYEEEDAVSVTGTATAFPVAGKFIMEVLGCDVCNQSTLIHAFIIFENAKLDANVDISFTTDGNHPFKLIAQQAYCDATKKLFSIVIPETEA